MLPASVIPESSTSLFHYLHGMVKISSLCQMLDMIWEEQQGMEVIYQWVQWLQNSSLSHLGITDEIILSKGDLTCDEDGGDERACLDDSAPDVIIPRIMRYNDDKRHEAFLHDNHDCMICFSECPGVVSPNILKTLLAEDEFERWENLLLQKTLDAMNDLVYCPRWETACLEDENNDAVCPSCLFSFCTLCTSHRHVGKECMTAEEKIRMLEERLKSRQLRSDHNQIDEVRNLQAIMRDAKQCPQCKIAISKIDGCNKMTCSNCGHYFCYQCNFAIVGYDHFKLETITTSRVGHATRSSVHCAGRMSKALQNILVPVDASNIRQIPTDTAICARGQDYPL